MAEWRGVPRLRPAQVPLLPAGSPSRLRGGSGLLASVSPAEWWHMVAEATQAFTSKQKRARWEATLTRTEVAPTFVPHPHRRMDNE